MPEPVPGSTASRLDVDRDADTAQTFPAASLLLELPAEPDAAVPRHGARCDAEVGDPRRRRRCVLGRADGALVQQLASEIDAVVTRQGARPGRTAESRAALALRGASAGKRAECAPWAAGSRRILQVEVSVRRWGQARERGHS